MSAWPKRKFLYWTGLVGIIALFCVYYLYFIYDLSRRLELDTMHIVKFMFILAAYFIGVFGLRRNMEPGLVRLWDLVYAVSVTLLVLLASFEYLFGRTPPVVREIADNIQEVLISPILYVAFSLFSYRKGL
jgi:hypothetical protein